MLFDQEAIDVCTTGKQFVACRRGIRIWEQGGGPIDAPDAIPHGGAVDLSYALVWREHWEPEWFV